MDTLHRPCLLALALVLLLGLVASACSSNDDGETEVSGEGEVPAEEAPADGSEPGEPEPAAGEPEPGEPEPAADEPEPGEPEPAADEPEPAPEATRAPNFASFRGVTEDTIKVGVAVPDFDALQRVGVPNYHGNNTLTTQVFIDRLNADGGIHGRMVEAVYIGYDFLNPSTQDEACIEFTEDHEVFIVIYGLLAENNLCLTDLHDTMVMASGYINSEVHDRSGDTLLLQLEPLLDAQNRLLASVVAEAGLLDGKTIGILANGGFNEGADGESMRDALAELGYDPKLYTATSAVMNDETLLRAEMDTFAQRMNADGIEFVFNVFGGNDTTQRLADAGFQAEKTAYTFFYPDTEAADKELLVGGITVGRLNDDDAWADPALQAECVDPVLEAHPELAEEFSYLPDGAQQAAGEPHWLTPVRSACNHVRLLKALGEIAGANLTNETFIAALDELGTFELHGYGQASFMRDRKWDGLDEFYIQEYDLASDSMKILGDPIVISR